MAVLASAAKRGRHAIAALAFAAATLGAVLAEHGDRPRTAAIVFLLGVTIVGAIEGVWGGLAAGLLASAIFNFFLAEPAFRFSFTSLEDYVPLIAFNASAITFGYLTGRLKDRAFAAETATGRLESLLALSERLQAAVRVADIQNALD